METCFPARDRIPHRELFNSRMQGTRNTPRSAGISPTMASPNGIPTRRRDPATLRRLCEEEKRKYTSPLLRIPTGNDVTEAYGGRPYATVNPGMSRSTRIHTMNQGHIRTQMVVLDQNINNTCKDIRQTGLLPDYTFLLNYGLTLLLLVGCVELLRKFGHTPCDVIIGFVLGVMLCVIYHLTKPDNSPDLMTHLGDRSTVQSINRIKIRQIERAKRRLENTKEGDSCRLM